MAEGKHGNQTNYIKALTASLEILTAHLSPGDVLVHLLTTGAIEMNHKEEIEAETTDANKVGRLVQILLRRKLEDYESFMDILKVKRVDLWHGVKRNEATVSKVPTGPVPGPATVSKVPTGPAPGPDTRTEKVDKNDLVAVAKQIALFDELDLTSFYSNLGITEEDVRLATAAENKPNLQVLRVLERWRSVQTSNATRDKVLEALAEEDHNDIIGALKNKWKIL